LVVDPHPIGAGIVRDHLQSWGIRVDVAGRADQGLARIAEAAASGQPYHIALLDAAGLGREVIEAHYCATSAPTRLILMLHFEEQAYGEAAKGRGFAGYVTKPFKQAALLEGLLSAIDASAAAPATQGSSGDPAPAMSPTPVEDTPEARLLLAEDNPVNRKLALLQLHKLGFQADAVEDGREAVAAMSRRPYDLVLMDCQMPELDGFEATAIIRALEANRGGHVPIIAMTANAMQGDREACLQAGMDDYLAKPVKPQELRRVIEHWLQPVA
jgi:CheY-like chemotaxis protein